MNCQGCGYRLWNLPPGGCPECGRAFKPSDFEFQPNAVQFCCPRCAQVYYGTDERGHLVPRTFDCVTCGEPLDMDRMLVRPAGGVDEASTGRERNPWVDRRRAGLVMAWLRTVGGALVTPHRLIAGTPVGATADAASFFVVTTFVYLLLAVIPFGVLFVALAAMGGGPGDVGELLLGGGMFLVVPMIGLCAFAGLQALVAHGVLRLTGGTAHGFGRTLQAVCYGGAGNFVVAIPCLGAYFAWAGVVWWLVSSILMLAKGQAVSGLRASAAALLLPVVVLVGAGAWVAWEVSRTVHFASQASLTIRTSATTEVGDLTRAVLDHAAAHGGAGPGHATALIAAGALDPWDFVDTESATMPEDVAIGGAALDAFDAAHAQAAAAALPAGVVAHRVGDFVFTYHGVPLDPPADPGLWLVVHSPDPALNAPPAAGASRVVGRADGSVRSIPVSAMAGELQTQNALRAAHGLAPLPMPETVTHDVPAVAP